MIKSWKHKGLKNFYRTGSKSGIQSEHADKLARRLLQLNSAARPEDMNTPGNEFHPLKGTLKEFYSVKVSGNWRIIFKFEGTDAILVDYLDYH